MKAWSKVDSGIRCKPAHSRRKFSPFSRAYSVSAIRGVTSAFEHEQGAISRASFS
jgi:hypothetical protein